MIWKCSVPLAIVLAAGLPAFAAAPVHNAPSKVTIHSAPGAPNTSFTAVVKATGELVRGVGATAASQPEGTGTYEVDFTNDVTSCSYVATVGQPKSTGSQPAAFITVVGRSGVPNGIFVETFARNGKLKNLPFHVDVGC